MTKHVLLEVAKRSRHRTTPDMPPGAAYDLRVGCWMVDGTPLVRSEGLRVRAATKKDDIETGEDHKGE
jgi:hypothetical protein